MGSLTENDIKVCISNSERLMEDAFKVSLATRPGLIELALEEVVKAWWTYFAIHPEGIPEELRGPNYKEKLEKKDFFKSHDVKIEEMKSIMKFILRELENPQINNEKLRSEVLKPYKYYSNNKKEKTKIERQAEEMMNNKPSKLKVAVENLLNITISTTTSEIKNLKEHSFYVDRRDSNLIEPSEPGDYQLLTAILIFNIVSYFYFTGDYELFWRLINRASLIPNFKETIVGYLIK